MTLGVLDRCVAILIVDGVAQRLMIEARRALDEAGIIYELVGADPNSNGWVRDATGSLLQIDIAIDEADPLDYDGVLVPGGERAARLTRNNPAIQTFLGRLIASARPVAVVGRAPQLLLNESILSGRKVAADQTEQAALENLGAVWVDRDVVVDRGLITARSGRAPGVFLKTMVREFSADLIPDNPVMADKRPILSLNA